MSPSEAVFQLHELDLLQREMDHEARAQRRRKLGLAPVDALAIRRQRERLATGLDRRWAVAYDRAQRRYGLAVAAVRERVCTGCYMGLPRTAAPPVSGSLACCESCGRILYWR